MVVQVEAAGGAFLSFDTAIDCEADIYHLVGRGVRVPESVCVRVFEEESRG